MFTQPRSRTKTLADVIVVCATTVILAACSEATAPEQVQVNTSSAYIGIGQAVPGDEVMVQLGQAIPGFAGLQFSNGSLILSMTDAAAASTARKKIRDFLRSRPRSIHSPIKMADDFVTRRVEYSFLQLAEYRTRLRRSIFALPGVVTLGVDETINRVEIGVIDKGVYAQVHHLLDQYNIPREAVAFELTERPVPFSHDLTARFSDYTSGLQGGWQITPGCTLGFTALSNNDSTFVTASHCTDKTYAYDGGNFYQPWSFTYPRIGYEITDPPSYECGFISDPCRNSDAALIAAEATIELGLIARTTYWRGDGSNGSIVIDHNNPELTITSRNNNNLVGEYLDKIGWRTGWTYGDVQETCEDVELTDGFVSPLPINCCAKWS